MDNLTHSLIGLIAGESVARLPRPPADSGLLERVRRGALVTLGVIGGNLPDLDLLYSYRGFSHDNKLGYMLEHRGYTHTIFGCLVLALLLYGLAALWLKRAGHSPAPRDRWALLGMALFGTALHLLMDALNSYGVHPFWPVENRWLYGDAVFIVEPSYWMAAAPLFFVVRTLATRIVLSLAFVAAVTLGFLTGMVPLGLCITLGILIAVLLVVGARVSPRASAATSAALFVAITLAFLVAGRQASAVAGSIASEAFPRERLVDHVLTPMPVNPLCWDLLLLQMQGDRYSVRHAMIALAPGVLPVSGCPEVRGDSHTTSPQSRVGLPDSTRTRWVGEFSMSRAQFAALVAEHCEARAFMQFARAPFAVLDDGRWIVGDLRFDREPEPGFSEIPLDSASESDAPGRCGRTAPWVPPRESLLDPAE